MLRIAVWFQLANLDLLNEGTVLEQGRLSMHAGMLCRYFQSRDAIEYMNVNGIWLSDMQCTAACNRKGFFHMG